MITALASALNVHADLLRIAVCIVGSYPLGIYVNKISPKKSTLKDLIVFSTGLFFLLGLFKLWLGVLTLFVISSLTYLLCLFFPQHKWMPWANFGLQMFCMLVSHCTEQFGDSDFVNEIGITGTQMILVQKLSAFAWDVYDGTINEKDLQNQHEVEKRIVKLPSLLRYFSFVFFFPTIMTGPSCSFNDYNLWIENKLQPELKDTERKEVIKSQKSAVLNTILPGLAWTLLYTLTANMFNYSTMYYEQWYTSKPLVVRIFFVYFVGLVYRTKYYSAWLLSEGACIACGIAYNGTVDGKTKWNRMTNVLPLKVELSQNFFSVFGNWNIITSDWLRYYIYVRVTPKGKKPGIRATFATFMVSALWHGTRPGYYLTFVTAAALQTFGKFYRKAFRPLFVDTKLKPAYDLVCLVITQISLGFCALPFIVLDIRPAIVGWKSVWFFVYVGMALSWPVMQFIKAKNRTNRDDKSDKKTK